MQVVEQFVSINGEGRKIGELALFIRFKGCNLNCSYCDTRWACENPPYTEMSPNEILHYAKEQKITNITLTGGEPLLQLDIKELISLLCENDFQVEVETNGSVNIQDFIGFENLSLTLDYKLESSHMESYMNTENYKYIRKNDTVKFVCGNYADLERTRKIIKDYSLTEKCLCIISPIFGSIALDSIVEYMKEHQMNQCKMQVQLHKIIWNPNLRGV